MAGKENKKQAVKKEDKEKKTQVKETKVKTEKVRKEKSTKAEKKPVKTEKVDKKKSESQKTEKKVNLRIMHLRPMITEKAVMMIEAQNVLTFETSMNETKNEIKEEVEEIFNVKVENVRTLIRNGKKYAYVKLNPKDLAIDIATKLGMI